MKKSTFVVAAFALAAQVVTPAFAGSYDFNPALGPQRTAAPAAMGYFRLPLHAGAKDSAQPRAGFMITSPQTYRVGQTFSRIGAPGMVDIGFTGRDLSTPWTATLNVSNTVAWAQNPDALPKNTHYLFESGLSWVVVGVISAGIIGGIYALSDKK